VHVALEPAREALHVHRAEVDVAQPLVRRARKARRDPLDFLANQRRGAVLEMRPFGFDFIAELVGPALLHQDLDACLVDVVAPFSAILNLRGRNENSGWKVDHWRMISHQTYESTISSRATPAK